MIEPKAAEAIALPDGRKIICVEETPPNGPACGKCVFNPDRVANGLDKICQCLFYRCMAHDRKDSKNVHFEFNNKQDYDDRS